METILIIFPSINRSNLVQFKRCLSCVRDQGPRTPLVLLLYATGVATITAVRSNYPRYFYTPNTPQHPHLWDRTPPNQNCTEPQFSSYERTVSIVLIFVRTSGGLILRKITEIVASTGIRFEG